MAFNSSVQWGKDISFAITGLPSPSNQPTEAQINAGHGNGVADAGWFNYGFNQLYSYFEDNHINGVLQYNDSINYLEKSVVKEIGGTNLYRSLTDNNMGNALSDPINWRFVGDISTSKLGETPIGGIIMYSGTMAALALTNPNWQECNGTNGTPDLQDRFIIGNGAHHTTGEIGGLTFQTTSNDGGHNHGITVNGHTLTIAEMPSHTHPFFGPLQESRSGTGSSHWPGNYSITANDLTLSTGGTAAHSHTASAIAVGNHNHTFDNRPPYYTLAYIMRIT